MVSNDCIIKIVPGEQHTPFGLAMRLGARAILESSSYQKGRERYSVLMVREAFRLTQEGRDIVFRPAGEGRAYRVESRARDILDVCQYFADQHAPVRQDFPFPAGGIGLLSYEFVRFCDRVRLTGQEDSLGLPDAVFLFGHTFLVFDHYTDRIFLIGLNYREARINLEAELAALERRLLQGETLDGRPTVSEAGLSPANPIPSMSDSDCAFKERVKAVKEEIIAGNLLQGVVSRRLVVETDIEPLEAYRRLRSNNPSPYMFFIDFGDWHLIGASPEVHVKAKDGTATVRPIAGTRRRGATKGEDLDLEAELLGDPKERAEHLMLVDLGRNDLGRVSAPGSVKVTDYMVTERYSHVMHLVSQVEGQLAAGRTGFDALRATFPAGTVSGAPKIRAMEVISRLERFQRRHYAGAIGYIEPGGNLDTCIGIRTALLKDGRLVLQAGAGVVYDSTPERELEETREKLGAVAAAFGLSIGEWVADESCDDESDDDGDVVVSVGYGASGGSTNSSAARSRLEPRPGKPPIWSQDGGSRKEIQDQIDVMIDEKEYTDQARRLAELDQIDPDKAAESWGGEDAWGDRDPLAADGGDDIDEQVRGIVGEVADAGRGAGIAEPSFEDDPWAEADAEAERLSRGNRDWMADPEPSEPEPSAEAPEPAPEIDPWAEAEAEAASLAGGGAADDEEIIPLDWDFDPSTATGTKEIQDEIDSLINAGRGKTDGGR